MSISPKIDWKNRILPLIYQNTPWVIFGTIIMMLLLGLVQWDNFESSRSSQKTNNAYVHFDNVIIESKVSGYIKEVLFSDFDSVEVGENLVIIEEDDYQMAVTNAQAQKEHASAKLQNLKLEENLQKANIKQAEAVMLSSQAKLELAKKEYERLSKLVKESIVSQAQFDVAEANFKSAQAIYEQNTALVQVQQRQLDLLSADLALREANLKSATAALGTANLNLSYTKIQAPIKGVTGACKVRVGELVKVGTQIVNLTPDDKPYIIANYKETQLTNVKVGQKVRIKVDMFPNQTLSGYVGSISPATGSTYSLLPTDNSSGNFTKVVQRIPVRIELDKNQALIKLLKGGMSATTWIDTEE